jgi:hypothetical protein
VADADPCEQDKLKAQFCVAVTVTPARGIVEKLITAVSSCGPVLAIMVAPAGKGNQLMGDVVLVDVTTNCTGVPGHAIADVGEIVNTGLGATAIKADTGELQKAPGAPVAVIVYVFVVADTGKLTDVLDPTAGEKINPAEPDQLTDPDNEKKLAVHPTQLCAGPFIFNNGLILILIVLLPLQFFLSGLLYVQDTCPLGPGPHNTMIVDVLILGPIIEPPVTVHV